MNTELSAIMATDGRMVEWSNQIKYNTANFSAEDREISAVIDNWAKELGRTGCDANHELSQMIVKAITPETVSAPSTLIDKLFDSVSVGEFDDYRVEVTPKNTIGVYESIPGGNVNRTYIDHKFITPTWITLQAETEVTLAELRRGGYKTVANLVNYINEALEMKKIATIISKIDSAATTAGTVTESTANPTATSMDALALYANDVADGTPVIFALSKYIQKVVGLTGVTTFLTDGVKNMYNTTGTVTYYAGCELVGIPTYKKLANGSNIITDKRMFAAGGKIGDVVTRGETQVLQSTDINSEKVHIKVGGYSFGTLIKDDSKVAKMILA